MINLTLDMGIALSILFLLFGSFLSAVGIRVAAGKSIIRPRSHCPNCQTALGPLDLVPVVSYIGSRGRCRYCQKPISLIYPIGELATAAMGLMLAEKYGFSMELLVLLVLFMIGIAVSVSDVLYMRIPNKILVPGMLVMLGLRLFSHPAGITSYLLGAFIGGGILFLLALLYPQGMGGGDVKLFLFMGLGIGWQNTILALFLASLLGSVLGLLLILFGFKRKGDPVPFGPFIVFASFVAALWGEQMWTYYCNLLF